MPDWKARQRDIDFRFKSTAANPDHRYVENRMELGGTAQALARDLWFALRISIKNGWADRAATDARRLAYLCTHYTTDSLNDPHQGMKEPT